MSKIKIILIVVGILLGFLTTTGLYTLKAYPPFNYNNKPVCNDSGPDLNGCLVSTESLTLTPQQSTCNQHYVSGWPLRSHSQKIINNLPCYPEVKTNYGDLPKLFETWQFVANLAVWSLVWLVVLFLLRKLYAHPRH